MIDKLMMAKGLIIRNWAKIVVRHYQLPNDWQDIQKLAEAKLHKSILFQFLLKFNESPDRTSIYQLMAELMTDRYLKNTQDFVQLDVNGLIDFYDLWYSIDPIRIDKEKTKLMSESDVIPSITKQIVSSDQQTDFVFCPHCGNEVQYQHTVCPYCHSSIIFYDQFIE